MTGPEVEACSYCDEEPPGTKPNIHSQHLAAPVSRPKRQRVIDERGPFSPGGASGRPPRTTFQTRAFRKTFFPNATEKEWNDWHWQARNRIRTLAQIERFLTLSEDEREALVEGSSMLPVSITPYYMSLVSRDDHSQPLRSTMIPSTQEFHKAPGEADDPLSEDEDSPIPGLVHRYPDRVLLLVSDFCSSYCRYCTRSRMVGHGQMGPQEARLQNGVDYLPSFPAIRD